MEYTIGSNIVLQKGDSIIIEPGEDSHSSRQKNAKKLWSQNTLANNKWYEFIYLSIYLFLIHIKGLASFVISLNKESPNLPTFVGISMDLKLCYRSVLMIMGYFLLMNVMTFHWSLSIHTATS